MKKMLAGMLNGLFALGICLLLVWGMFGSVRGENGFAGGTGTHDDPYLVATAEQLDNIRHHLGAHFKLIADIDLGVPPWNEGEGWLPIGNIFTGALDGNGHVIYNLMINRPGSTTASDYVGLFGRLSGAVIRDLHLIDVSVVGRDNIGGLVGQANSSTVTGVSVSGSVTGSRYTGGLIGHQSGGILAQSSSRVQVTSGNFAGGLVGYCDNTAHIGQSFSLGAVDGANDTGGLVGWFQRGTLIDSYARGPVTGGDNVGGLIGRVGSTYQNGDIYRTYSSGAVSGTGSNVGGLIGRNVHGYFGDNYWDIETSDQEISAGGAGVVGKTTLEMQQQATYELYNFNRLWQIEEGVDYPVFQDLHQYAQPTSIELSDLAGDGTPENPYLITNADELNAMRLGLDQHYQLANDIDASATVVWDGGLGWEPVGASGAAERFTGELDGDGFAIYNLAVMRPRMNYQGLFGYLDGAELHDLHLLDVSIYAQDYTAGLAARVHNSTITGMRVSGVVRGNLHTGGLAGYLDAVNLVQSSSTVQVKGDSNTGGLVGHARGNSTHISQSYSLGAVEGNNAVGGLVGHLHSGTLTNSFAHSSTSGDAQVGGLVGRVGFSTSNGYIYNTYSKGVLSGTTDVGGLIGLLSNGSTSINFWDTQTSEQASSAGGMGVVGKPTAEMQQRATFTNWNFTTLWRIDEGVDYPAFKDLSGYSQPGEVDLIDLEGEGTAENPYILTTADELNAMRQDLAAHYKLGNDIDLSASVVWDGGWGWKPVGTSGTAFTGELDGDGYTIYNLVVNRPGTQFQGLFGILQNAEMRDLHLVNFSVHGGQYTGGLAGRANSSTIDQVFVSGWVSGSSDTGGMIGFLTGGTVLNSANAGNIIGSSSSGGLIGGTDYGTIITSYNLGSVSGADRVGGLIGYNYRTKISDSFSTGNVSGEDNIGGLVGLNGGSSWAFSGYIERSFSSGAVSGLESTNYIGGFLGRAGNYQEVYHSYWDTETSGQDTSFGGVGVVGKTTVEMQQQATFITFNFNTLWQIDEGNSYPVFQDLSQYAQPELVDLADLDGDGSPGNPYIITTADELNAMRQDLAAHYMLGNDIDLSASVVSDNGRGWVPIGTTSVAFSGGLDGDGYALHNLTISRTASELQGLFSILQNAEVRDLHLVNVSVQGGQYSGGLAGRANSSTIEEVFVSGWVSGSFETGGMVGILNSSMIQNSASAVEINGSSNSGGLIGRTDYSTISGSYSLGLVNGNDFTGGLVGRNYRTSINNCYSWAEVSGNDQVGGLVGSNGSNSWSYPGIIDKSYSVGSVSGSDTATQVGGLLGALGNYSTVTNNYWDTDTSGQSSSAGGAGVVGKTTAEMQQEATFTNWDFTTIWDIVETESYPFHRDMEGMIALIPVAHNQRNEASAGHTFQVVSNLAWTAETADPWITVTCGDSGRDNGTVTYGIIANPVPDLHTGTIIVSDGAGIARVFTVHQGATLEVSYQSHRHDAAPSSGHSFNVRGNVRWTATADHSWIVITAGTPGADAGVVTYRVAENLSLAGRDGTITVSGGGITQIVDVHQAGALPHLEIESSYAEHGHAASTGHTIAVNANQDWTAETDAAWITLVSFSGTGDGTIEYSLETNHHHKSRSGSITITNGQRTLSFRVTQALSWTVTLQVDPVGGGTPSGAGQYADGAPVTVSVIGNPGYTFVNWTEGGVTVSTDAAYAFTAQRSRALTAHFSTNPPVFNSTPVTDAIQDVLYTYNVEAFDPDPDDVLTISALTKPAWLTLTDHGDGTATLTGTPTNADVGDHEVLLQVVDLTEETDIQAFTIIAENVNDPPEFTSSPIMHATQDVTYEYHISATDPDLIHGDILTITAETMPGWLALTPVGNGTATLSGTPTNANVGDHDVVLKVTDVEGLFDTQSFTINVENVNDPPEFTSEPDNTAIHGVLYIYNITATDPDLIHGDVLVITADPKPDWLTLEDKGDGTATLSGTPAFEDIGLDHDVTLFVTDLAGLFDTQPFIITVIQADAAPTITSTDHTYFVLDTYGGFTVTADGYPIPALTIEGELPAGIVFSPGDGTAELSGTPEAGSDGIYSLTIRASNGVSPDAVQSFTLTVATESDTADELGGTLWFNQGQVQLIIPPGTLDGETAFLYLFHALPSSLPYEGLTFAGISFHLTAFDTATGEQVVDFNSPVTVVIHYDPAQMAAFDLESLRLYRLSNEGVWQDAVCDEGEYDYSEPGQFSVPLCGLSEFAVFGELLPVDDSYHIFLPLILY